MSLSIRLLTEADIEDADLILKSAFCREESRIPELRLYRKLQPEGWFLAICNGRPAGIVGGTNYAGFGYVGMMAVQREFQRQRVALTLMSHLLDWIDGQSIPMTFLDASDMGQPLYEKLGFQAYDRTYVMQHGGVVPVRTPLSRVELITTGHYDALAAYDANVFGADRGRVLRTLLANSNRPGFLVRDKNGRISGYLFVQEKRIGPWVAERQEDAEVLLQAALSLLHEGPVSVVVPEVNQEGVSLLTHYGFSILRTNRHMGRGKGKHPIVRRKVYAQTNLSLG